MDVMKYSARIPISLCDKCQQIIYYCECPPMVHTWPRRIRYAITTWWLRNRPHVHRGPCQEDA